MGMYKISLYSETYKELCFQAWYLAGRPKNFVSLAKNLTADDSGNTPSIEMLRKWRSDYGWDARADELDAKASLIVNEQLVESRVSMLKEQAIRARELQTMGLQYLKDEGFDSSSSAVSAVIKGAELERTSKGITEQIMALLQLNDKQLTSQTMRLLERLNVNDSEIVDMEEEPDDEGIEKEDNQD